MLAGRISLALVDVVLAMIALVSLVAFARVTTDTIHAGPSLARIAIAFVDIHFAIFPHNALHAKTFVPEISKFTFLPTIPLSSLFSMLTRSHSRN